MGISDKYRLFLCILCFCGEMSAQTPDTLPPFQIETFIPRTDSTPKQLDILLNRPDTLPRMVDTLVAAVDSAIARVRLARNLGIREEVNYGARDSMYFDIRNKQLHLWGEAYVRYTDLDITAGYILVDYVNNVVTAEPFPDTSGRMQGIPAFKNSDQNFTAQRIRYNFKTEKGKIQELSTRQEDLYVVSEAGKFIGTGGDSTLSPVFYNKDALITTCDAEHKHYGIRARKQKVVPDKLVVTGMSNLEVAGIPTPLILPFGFYPITKSRKAGLIIPRDFEFADAEGLGIKQWGWYQPVNEHVDLTAQFNAYVSGSFGTLITTRYNKRYGYNGNLQLEYNRRVQENAQAQKVTQQSYGLRLTHNQDPKAHPSRKFGGTINLQTNNNQSLNNNDYSNVFQNELRSNLNYYQSFPGKPYSYSASFSHSQNTRTRLMNVSFPTAQFTLQRIYPFKRKEVVGKSRWYEQVTFVLRSEMDNRLSAPDTAFFTSETLRNSRAGIRHTAGSDINFKLFKYINLSPRINYEENWYPYTTRRELLDSIVYRYDTIRDPENPNVILSIVVDSAATTWGLDTMFREWGFSPFRTFDAGVSLSTALFFTQQFKKGWFRGFRHTIKPSISTGFGPDFSGSNYFRTVETDLRPGFNDTITYNIFEDNIYGRPSQNSRDIVLSYSLLNVLEFKHRSKKAEGGLKKVRIFDNLTFSGNYNLSADSLQWSPISTGGLFRLFKGVSQFTWNTSFDPYILNERGVRVDRFVLKEEGKLVRVANLGLALNTNFSVGQLRDMIQGKGKAPAGGYDDLAGWLKDFHVTHRIGWALRPVPGTNRDTFALTTNNISVYGRIPLSSKWSFDIGNISYDFPSRQIVYPDFGLTRDLHCWQISLRTQPVRGTYELFINVKPGTLDFLKVPYRKNNFDGRAVF